jgi:hypothetical protein
MDIKREERKITDDLLKKNYTLLINNQTLKLRIKHFKSSNKKILSDNLKLIYLIKNFSE